MAVGGWAVDGRAEAPARAVFITIDGSVNFQAVYGDDRPDVAEALHSDRYRKSGFDVILPTDQLTRGRHILMLKVVAVDGSYYEPDRKKSPSRSCSARARREPRQ